MLKNDRSTLNYPQLVKAARTLVAGRGKRLKVALLADVSTQHLTPLLRVLFANNGFDADIYEAGFDTFELEAFDSASGTFAFAPDLVVILQSLGKLKSTFYDFPGDRNKFSQILGEKTEAVWKAIQSRSRALIVQSTFVVPYERPFGNYGFKVENTLHGAVIELNREICHRARVLPGVVINDVDYLAAWVGRSNFLDEKLWTLAKCLCALEFLPDIAQNIVDIGLAAAGRIIKCVVIDLDNTIWGGVLGDDGLEGLELGELDDGHAFRFFQLYLRELSRRGILLAVCSKNDEATARKVFEEHHAMVLKLEHIAMFVANWEDKATNIRRISLKLNIGFDAMVFLDDNPFERNLVRQLIPEIIVPELPEDPALFVRTISELNLFETTSNSVLDSERNSLYQTQETREQEVSCFADINEYLRSLDSIAQFKRFQPKTLARIAQLIQRSNQFNLTTPRYSEAECEALMMDEQSCYPFSVEVRDRFGEFGLINVVVLRRSANAANAANVLEIDTFLMSCRVLQRGVEQFAMNKIFEYAKLTKIEQVLGRYVPTEKNAMVKGFYAQFGFSPAGNESDVDCTTWVLAVSEYVPREVFIRELPSAHNPTQDNI